CTCLGIAMTYHPGPRLVGDLPRTSLWHRNRPATSDPHTSVLFWLTVLGLACVSLLSVAWGTSWLMAQKGSEKLLRVERLFPKLNSSHAERKVETFRISEHESSELPHPKDWKTAATAEPPRDPEVPPAPVTSLIVPLELTSADTCQDPLIYQHR